MILGTDMTCTNCLYWNGMCRRRAPSPDDSTHEALWPVTAPDDWCGEYHMAQELEEMYRKEQVDKFTQQVKDTIFAQMPADQMPKQ